MGFMKIIKEIDVFGSPFTVVMGVGNDKRKTLFGALFSLLLIAAAIGYFAYLNYQFANDTMPKITSTEERIKEVTELDYSIVNIAFSINYDDGDTGDTTTLELKELYLGQDIINYKVTYKYFNEKTKDVVDQPIQTKSCKDILNGDDLDETETSDSQCLDLSQISEDLQVLKNYPKNEVGVDSEIQIELNSCHNQNNCVTDADLIKYLFSENTYITFTLTLQQLDYNTGKVSQKVMAYFWNFEENLQITGSIRLIPSKATIKSGFLFSKDENYFYFTDVDTTDSYAYKGPYKDKNGVDQKGGVEINKVATFKIFMGGKIQNEIIQYPQYPQVLAEFASILNVLLIVGIIAKLAAKSEITTYFMEQRLKEQYKTNAYKMLKNKDNQETQKKDASEILKANKKVVKDNTLETVQKTFKVSSLSNCIKNLLAENKDDFKKKKMSKKDKDIYEVLYYESGKCRDIFEIQREILSLKKAISLLLTPEQYAAVKCCGGSIEDQIPFLLDRQNKEKKNKQPKVLSQDDNKIVQSMSEEQVLLQAKQQLNHLEQIDKLEYDKHFFKANVINFYKQSQEGFSSYDEHSKRLNERLLECLNKTYQTEKE